MGRFCALLFAVSLFAGVVAASPAFAGTPIACEDAYENMRSWINGDGGEDRYGYDATIEFSSSFSSSQYSASMIGWEVVNTCGHFPSTYVCDERNVSGGSISGSLDGHDLHQLMDSSYNKSHELRFDWDDGQSSTYTVSSCEERSTGSGDYIWYGSVQSGYFTYYVTVTYVDWGCWQ